MSARLSRNKRRHLLLLCAGRPRGLFGEQYERHLLKQFGSVPDGELSAAVMRIFHAGIPVDLRPLVRAMASSASGVSR
jgi:hypothetical protein